MIISSCIEEVDFLNNVGTGLKLSIKYCADVKEILMLKIFNRYLNLTVKEKQV